MNHKEMNPWLGQVQLVNDTNHPVIYYSATVAIWSHSPEHFEQTLRSELLSRHLQLVNIQQAMPAIDWLRQYPADTSSFALARSVNPNWALAFGDLLEQSQQQEAINTRAYISTQIIHPVVPLDRQFGAWPKKTVPDILRPALFDQPDPTEADIAFYGSLEAVPPLKTYMIIESAKIMFFDDPGYVRSLPCRCLYSGDAAKELGSVAPYIIELQDDNDFTRTLFSYLENWHENSTIHLWHKNAGIYLRSRDTLSTLRQHFKKYTKLQDPNTDKWFFLRFYDPQVMHYILQQTANKPHYLSTWLGRKQGIRIHDILYRLNDESTFYHCQPNADLYTQEHPPTAIKLDQTYRDIFALLQQDQLIARISDAIATDYGDHHGLRDKPLEDFIRQALAQATSWGLQSELAYGQYIAASVIVGQAISPQYAKEHLHGPDNNTGQNIDFFSPNIHENQRTEQLLQAAINTRQARTATPSSLDE